MHSFYRIILAVVFVGTMTFCSSKTETAASSLDTSAVEQVFTSGAMATQTEVVEVATGANANTDSLPARTIGQMILEGKLIPSDNKFTFQMMDSLNAVNKSARPFYFTVFDKIMKHADGALSEAIGNYALTYVEQNPVELFQNLGKLEKHRFDAWASFVGIELFLSANNAEEGYKKFAETFSRNCKGCSKAEVQKMNAFNKLVWQTMQANIDADKKATS